MANPQIENGYTKIANEIYDALCRIRIPGEANQVFNAIVRKTYGYNKKEDRIALSQLCLATGLQKGTVCKALNKLKEMNLITVTQKGNRTDNIFSINKDFDSWKPLPKKVTLPNLVTTVTQKGNTSLPKKVHTKDNTTKDNTKDISEQSSEGLQINQFIELFKVLNPTYQYLFSHKTQRSAVVRLLKLRDPTSWEKVIAFIVSRRNDQYCPRISTPIQLEQKYAALEIYAQTLKQSATKKEENIAFT